MNVPSPEAVHRLHDRIINQTGGSLGLREPGMLIAICEKPHASFGGSDLYPTLESKVAAFFEALVNYHVFVDGNKRTAVVATMFFLHLNEKTLAVSDKDFEAFVLKVATTNPEIDVVAAWFRKHLN